jgi:hypothetical protein
MEDFISVLKSRVGEKEAESALEVLSKVLSERRAEQSDTPNINTTLTLSGSQDRGVNEGIRDRLVGAWRLAWLEEEGTDGEVHRVDCAGILVFTREGRMSVQVMYRNPLPGTQAGSVQYAQGGYEASFGRYEIDERAHSFTYHVEGALVRTLINKYLTRIYEFSGEQLIVKSSSPDEHWKVAWERC